MLKGIVVKKPIKKPKSTSLIQSERRGNPKVKSFNDRGIRKGIKTRAKKSENPIFAGPGKSRPPIKGARIIIGVMRSTTSKNKESTFSKGNIEIRFR